MEYIDEHLQPCGEAFEQEKILWNYTSPATLAERTEKLKSALRANIEWFNKHLPGHETPIEEIVYTAKEAVKVEYVNMEGLRSSRPWNGVNIKVTTYDDGSISTTKTIVNH